ncbi:PAS domain S-box protein [Phenylobacterium sp.]|uniref:sensor histidine kinase n=1 Tax=Phenylobacterium sp. TaxID=1871053 RepID=UPI0030F49563
MRSAAFRDAILNASLDAIVIIGQDSLVLEWSPAAEVTFGYARDEAIGRELSTLIIPEELREAHHRGMAHYLATGEGPVLDRRIEVQAINKAGDRLPIELAISPTEIDGRIQFTAFLRDISERVAAERALREGGQRLRATHENAFAAIGEVDQAGRFLRTNAHFSTITGYTAQELSGLTIWDITEPDDLEADRAMFARQMAGELATYSVEKRYLHKSGSTVWVEVAASTVTDEFDRPLYGVRVVRDVSERRTWLEHQRLLINELNHRVKNTLATVQSIAAQTLRAATDTTSARYDLEERLAGLSRAHDVLTRESWERAGLVEIVSQALQPYRPAQADRILTQGPQVWLGPRCALALAMAFQELATNAVKYGALSVDQGVLELRWHVAGDVGARVLNLHWTEDRGPTANELRGEGFGMRLLKQSLARELGGRVELDFRPTGLVCQISAPLD